MIFFTYLLTLSLTLTGFNELVSHTSNAPLTVTLTEYSDIQAPFRIAVFKPTEEADFPKNIKHAKAYHLAPKGQKTATLVIDDLPYGEYALAVFQDINNNGKMDTNLLGIPQEPYCFSTNFRPRLRAPRFADCLFTYSATQHEQLLQLIKH